MYERPLILEEYDSQEEELTWQANQNHIHAGTSLEELSIQKYSIIFDEKMPHLLRTKIDNEIEMNENPVYFLHRKWPPLLLLQNKENEVHNDTVRVTYQ